METTFPMLISTDKLKWLEEYLFSTYDVEIYSLTSQEQLTNRTLAKITATKFDHNRMEESLCFTVSSSKKLRRIEANYSTRKSKPILITEKWRH